MKQNLIFISLTKLFLLQLHWISASKQDDKYDQARSTLLDALSKNNARALEEATEILQQTNAPARRKREDAPLIELAKKQKEELIKKDRVLSILHSFYRTSFC